MSDLLNGYLLQILARKPRGLTLDEIVEALRTLDPVRYQDVSDKNLRRRMRSRWRINNMTVLVYGRQDIDYLGIHPL